MDSDDYPGLDGGAAFPSQEGTAYWHGMSLREWYAGQALVGIIPLDGAADCTPAEVAHDAFQYADAMIAEGEK